MGVINLVREIIKSGQFTGILLIDNIAKDLMGEARMVTQCEMSLIKKRGLK